MVENIQPDIDPTVRTKNAATFLQALACQSSDIVLTGDIELNTSMFNFSSRFMPFTGSIDGQGHQLKNVSYTVSDYEAKTGNNDNNATNVALLPFARNAHFKDLELNDFVINSNYNRVDTAAIFVANSYKCTYDNISITGNSSITRPAAVQTTEMKPMYVVGGLIGNSYGDKITDCSVGPLCQFQVYSGAVAETDEVGGIAARSEKTHYLRCMNQGTVIATDDYAGGIVGYSVLDSIESCLNLGAITGEEQVGGIAGYADATDIRYCVNTGTVTGNSSLNEKEIGGIVGTLDFYHGAKVELTECANWGKVVNSYGDDFTKKNCGKNGAIIGNVERVPTYGNCYYNCNVNGESVWNVSVGYGDIQEAGSWTYNYYQDLSKTGIFYQDIDNKTFPTNKPVPIPAAGKVYQNYHCDGKVYYSNKYASKNSHTSASNKFNICSVCGARLSNTAPTDITIINADEMEDFRYAVGKSQDFTKSTVSLDNDIDMSGKTFSPIGTYERPYLLGTFNGNYHRIKNLSIKTTDGIAGLFGCITGNAMMIENVIIDSTCVVKTDGIASAGLVGCVDMTNGNQASLTISHCGNNASVTGTTNVAGILGSVFTNDDMVLNIENCYNTGTIKGDKESAAICGYGRDHATVTRTWNSGSVTGCDEGYPFLRYNTSKTLTANYCYDVNGQSSKGVSTFDAADLQSGRLTYLLNGSRDGGVNSDNTYLTWCQKIGTDSHPVIKYSSASRVYHHDRRYCDATTTTDTTYNNSGEVITTILHSYDSDGICTRTEGEVHGEPIEAVNNVWQVTKPGDLYYIAQEVNNGNTQYDIELMNDVTDNLLVQIGGYLSPYYQTFHVWTPIGTTEHPFTKSFSGNYHTVKGLYCDKGIDSGISQEPVGLFGALQDNSSIANVSVQNCYFRSYWKTGLLAGSVMNSTNSPVFHDIYTVGAVKGVTALGGMIGFIQDKNFNTGSK